MIAIVFINFFVIKIYLPYQWKLVCLYFQRITKSLHASRSGSAGKGIS